MKNSKLHLLLLLLLSSFSLVASHIPGAHISYRPTGNPMEYIFTLTIYRTCPGGHPSVMNANTFMMTNSCGFSNPTLQDFVQVGVEEDVSQLCPTAVSSCYGGQATGIWKYTYESKVLLPANCADWTISFEMCCRDQSANLLQSGTTSMYCKTTLNTLAAPDNHSVEFRSIPIPYACSGEEYRYCLSTADVEGDSVAFRLVPALGTAGLTMSYAAGYSELQPLQQFQFDERTGCMSFEQAVPGHYVVTIEVLSYNKLGQLIGSIIYDFKVVVLSCSNAVPQFVGLNNFQGTGQLNGANEVDLCYGDSFSVEVVFEDTIDAGDQLSIQTNALAVLPGAQFVQQGSNPVRGILSWKAVPGYSSSLVHFTVEDDACPYRGQRSMVLKLTIGRGVFTVENDTLCMGEAKALVAHGVSDVEWFPTQGLSCTTCLQPVAQPNSSRTYYVRSTNALGCQSIDSVHLEVVPTFAVDVVGDTAVCAGESFVLQAQAAVGRGPYRYQWFDAGLVPSAKQDQYTTALRQSQYIGVEVQAQDGCTMRDSLLVRVEGRRPEVTILTESSLHCPGDTIDLEAEVFLYPLSCGLSTLQQGQHKQATVAEGLYYSSSCSPFMGHPSTSTKLYKRVQYLYTKEELNAAGIYGGTIDSLGFFLMGHTGYQFDSVEIRISCTSLDYFPNVAFEQGLTRVMGPVNDWSMSAGGLLMFDIANWDWDGEQNLIVELYTQEDESNDEGSLAVHYALTPSTQCLQFLGVNQSARQQLTGSATRMKPRMQLSILQERLSQPLYQWTNNVSSGQFSTLQSTVVLEQSVDYVLTAGNQQSACVGFDTVSLTVKNLSLSLSEDTMLCASTGSTVALSAQLFEGNTAMVDYYTQPVQQQLLATGALYAQESGGDIAINVQQSLPRAITDVVLEICVIGDYSSSSERFDFYGEGGVHLGTYTASSAGVNYTDCSLTAFCNRVIIPAQLWNQWIVDGQLDLHFDASVNVNANCTINGLTNVSSWINKLEVAYTGAYGGAYQWEANNCLSVDSLKNPIVTLGQQTEVFYLNAMAEGCVLQDSVTITYEPLVTKPVLDTVAAYLCPNKEISLGVQGNAGQLAWYSKFRGQRQLLGNGATLDILPRGGERIYVRREGACNISEEDSVELKLLRLAYAQDGTQSGEYCTDDFGWNHFHINGEIILSLQGDLSAQPKGTPIVQINEATTFYQQRPRGFRPRDCATGNYPGEERFELGRSWSVDWGAQGQLTTGRHAVRFYHQASARATVEQAASSHQVDFPDCGYTYKYSRQQLYWFVDSQTVQPYRAPAFEGRQIAKARYRRSACGHDYVELNSLRQFTGGSAAIILSPERILSTEGVELSGEAKQGVNVLQWVVQRDFAAVELQRSSNAIDFETLEAFASYYEDRDLRTSGYYYRLRVVTMDGREFYTATLYLEQKGQKQHLNIYPNPCTAWFAVDFVGEDSSVESCRVRIFTNQSVELFGHRVEQVGQQLRVDVQALPAGVYYVQCVLGEQTYMKKIIKG